MDLRTAVELVYTDVTNSDDPDVTLAEAVQYARDIDTAELQVILNTQRMGLYSGDTYGAYVDVRHADQAELDRVIADLTSPNSIKERR